MSEAIVFPAPVIETTPDPDGEWRREYRAFLHLRSSLLGTHRHHYVAIHEGKVVASGDDKVTVALQTYAQYGYVPIYVGFVSEGPRPAVRIPSPRLGRGVNGP